MDSNTPEKKPKRPRIGQPIQAAGESHDSSYERPYTPAPRAEGNDNGGEEGGYKRPYQPRPYNNQGGYHRPQRPYGPQGYDQRPTYQPRANYVRTDDAPAAEGDEKAQGENQGYQPRPQRPYNNQGGYQRQPRPYNNQGGYQPRQQRPYNNQGGQQGGYQPRQQRPYNNQGGQQGGYQRPQRPYNNQGGQQGGYQPRQQRPYNNQGGQQGGYQPRQQRPYNNQGGQQGGYQRPGQRPYNKNNRQQGQGNFPRPGKSFTPRPKRVEYEVPIPDPNEQIRLNKYMSNAGICSRREADEYIQQGLVKVNGQVVTELGTKISYSDVVEYDEKVVTPESKCYILLNKPKDCVTTSDDPNGRLTVMDLVKGACQERIYPVGRLDRNTTGVLLLTNDGDLASKLTHPKFVKKKIYHVWCDRDISEEDMQRIADGIELEDGEIHADAISYATETDRNQAGIEIHSGRNRIVRRIFESLGYHVTKLDRVYFAGLTKKNLPRGRWRYLTQEEVNYLKMGSFE